jgi:hypothetical protein
MMCRGYRKKGYFFYSDSDEVDRMPIFWDRCCCVGQAMASIALRGLDVHDEVREAVLDRANGSCYDVEGFIRALGKNKNE